MSHPSFRAFGLGVCLFALPPLFVGCHAQAGVVASNTGGTIIKADQPFLFGYGSWDKHARIENGVIFLDADGMSPKGGAGVNLASPLNLTALADNTPVLCVRVGARNTLKTLKLMLGDPAGNTGTWFFDLTKVKVGDVVEITPNDGASLGHPNEIGKSGSVDLAHVFQWQMMGDWGGDGPVDVQVQAILTAAPSAAVLQARKERDQRDAEAREQANRERLEQRTKYPGRTAQSPAIETVYAAAPNILALRIQSGKIVPGRVVAYHEQAGDTRRMDGPATILTRAGKDVGYLIGPKKDSLALSEGFEGDPLLVAESDDPANYLVRSKDDPAFAAGVSPTSVSRKSIANDWRQPKKPEMTVRHNIYLRLPRPLTPGKTYIVSVGHLNTRQSEAVLAFHPSSVWSEAVHVDQAGFRPDDPLKRAYLSLWMGWAGGAEFPAGVGFHVVDAAGKTVFTGKAGKSWPADKPEVMHVTRNFNGASVTPLDFSGLTKPGVYRVVVDGVGCSYPFPISSRAWEDAFKIQMKGFYNERSGVALGPPYTQFVRPRDFYPGDPGVSVTQSTYSNLDGGDSQKDLAKGDTGKSVPGAWGGYHDAGDWNPRRITHMRTTTFWQLELMQLYPDYFHKVSLNIPKTHPMPDLVNECLFELSLFHRLQRADGAVSFGIETDGDPIDGEVSWKQSMPAYVYAVDVQSTYIYAQVASRAAAVLAADAPKMADEYRESALRAMAWAEQDRARRQSAGTWSKLSGDVSQDRALAAICLYALTKDKRWHSIFLEETSLKGPYQPFYGALQSRDAAFTYARLPDSLADPAIKAHARQAIINDADGALAYQAQNAWGIASNDPGKPQFLGFYSTPHGAVSLVRAYYLTHDKKYLTGAVGACLFPNGANPNNMAYTSGLGSNPVRHVLNLDSRFTGQPAPVGLTPYGNVDLTRWSDTWITWPITYFMNNTNAPVSADWPTSEAYFDVFFMPAENEFCIDQTMGPQAYVWGALAAR